MCRALCDRVQRSVVALSRTEAVSGELLHYLDRLSAWFMASSRAIATRTRTEWVYG
jgi:cob(I)alamin adenosyltransferase